jgi:integrase/recombinase XerD
MKSFQLGLWEAPIPSRVHDDERLIAMWLHGKSDNTRDAYFRDVLLFTDFVDKPLPQVDLADLQAYVDSLSGYRPSTRARKLSSVKSLLSFGHRLGYLRVNVGAVVKPPPVKDTLAERILDEHDVAAIIRSEPNRRNQLMLDLLYKSGMRVSELCALTWRDVRDRRGSLQVTVFGKGGRTRVILLPPRLSTRLRAFRNVEEASRAVFQNAEGEPLHRSQVYRIVRSAARRCGLAESVSPHWFRHAHASHALDNGAPTHLVQQTLGHASLATTGRYTHARPKDSSALYVEDEKY